MGSQCLGHDGRRLLASSLTLEGRIKFIRMFLEDQGQCLVLESHLCAARFHHPPLPSLGFVPMLGNPFTDVVK